MMRRVIVREFGSPAQLQLADLPDPSPGPGQVVVRVRAAAVNRIDISTRNGNLARAGLLAEAAEYGMGWDVAGEVSAAGPAVRRFAVGDRVIGLRDVLSDGGTHADAVLLDERAVAPAPRGLSYEEAGALPLAGLTAARSLSITRLRAGQWLLVTGAAGGVGRVVVDLARIHGIRVVAMADGRDADELRARGADHVVSRGADLAREVRRCVAAGVDAVIDGAVLGVRAHEALRPEGVFVALVAPFAPPAIRATRVVVQEVFADGGLLTMLSALAEVGQIGVPVAGTYSLEDVSEAHRAVERGGLSGRVMLVP